MIQNCIFLGDFDPMLRLIPVQGGYDFSLSEPGIGEALYDTIFKVVGVVGRGMLLSCLEIGDPDFVLS